MLRKLNDDHAALLKKEELSKDFLVSLGETPKAYVPNTIFFPCRKNWKKSSAKSVL